MTKSKIISCDKHPSLMNLDWKPGEVVGFYNSDLHIAKPFILAIPEKITRGFERKGLRLEYSHPRGEYETWTLHPKGYMLALNIAFRDKFRYDILKKGLENADPYEVDKAYAGKDAIRNALNGFVGSSQYAHLINERQLVVERGPVGSLVEKLGLGFILPNQLRIRDHEPERVIRGM